MSDSTPDDVERIDLDDLAFEDAVPVVMAAFGMTEDSARNYLAITRDLETEGPLPVTDAAAE